MSVTALVPRPAGIPDTIPDSLLVEACRCYLQGEKPEVVAVALNVSLQQFYSIVRTAQWRALQTAFRDEFVDSMSGKLTRLESQVLNKLEDQLQNGVKRYTMMGEEYQAQLSPKEVIAIAGYVQQGQAYLHKLKQLEAPDRKTFDAAERMAQLERFAKAKEINADRST